MVKRLASLTDMRSEAFRGTMRDINQMARHARLNEYTTYSRLWEYPWASNQLLPLGGKGLSLLDVGTELSPMAWFLAGQAFDVTVSDRTARYWKNWRRAESILGVKVHKRIVDALCMDFPTASVDICTSFSVFEHIPDQKAALAEMARVLRPGGTLLMTFDICEPEMGMAFPKWNGCAPTLRQVDALFRESPWFEPGFSDLKWNTEDIQTFLEWHRTTAPHHNYVTCGVTVRRNGTTWTEPRTGSRLRAWRGRVRAALDRGAWAMLPSPGTRLYGLCCKATAFLTKIRQRPGE
jgi:SAM-dependent methyltransferase